MATHRYSLLDSDLPLLAVDAACEIDSHIFSGYKSKLTLDNTKLLLQRLQLITSAENTGDVDRQLYVHALSPSHGNGAELLEQPISVKTSLERLGRLLTSDKPEQADEQVFLTKLRDIFLGISDFALETRRNLVSNDSGHPYATL